MMKKRLKKLRAKLAEEDITQQQLATAIGKSETYVSARMQCKASFTVAEAYHICEVLSIALDEFMVYFPPGLA